MRRECGKVSDKAETIVRFLQCTKTVAFGPVRHSILIDIPDGSKRESKQAAEKKRRTRIGKKTATRRTRGPRLG